MSSHSHFLILGCEMIFWLDWMNNMNHSTCHWWFLWPEPSANGSGSTSRGFISAPRPGNQQLKTSPQSPSSPPDSVNPPKARLPVTAHRIQPPACSHSISLIREASALLFIVVHMEKGEQNSNAVPTCVYTYLFRLNWLAPGTDPAPVLTCRLQLFHP